MSEQLLLLTILRLWWRQPYMAFQLFTAQQASVYSLGVMQRWSMDCHLLGWRGTLNRRLYHHVTQQLEQPRQAGSHELEDK